MFGDSAQELVCGGCGWDGKISGCFLSGLALLVTQRGEFLNVGAVLVLTPFPFQKCNISWVTVSFSAIYWDLKPRFSQQIQPLCCLRQTTRTTFPSDLREFVSVFVFWKSHWGTQKAVPDPVSRSGWNLPIFRAALGKGIQMIFLELGRGQVYFDHEEFQWLCLCISRSGWLPRCSLERVSLFQDSILMCFAARCWNGLLEWTDQRLGFLKKE